MKISALLSIAALAAALADPPIRPLPRPNQPIRNRFEPGSHFTPAKNWMNDPCGLVSYRGKHHNFYQYNPFGNVWDFTISWGHAVSKDMVHWEELPVAIPATDTLSIFTGSAVVDDKNGRGFGTRGNPPLVAIYTVFYRKDGIDPNIDDDPNTERDESVIPRVPRPRP